MLSVTASHAQAGGPFAGFDGNWAGSGTVALSNVSPSEDGRLLGYAISKSGSDRQEIFVRDDRRGVNVYEGPELELKLGRELVQRALAGSARGECGA